jgi:hypothetical protein
VSSADIDGAAGRLMDSKLCRVTSITAAPGRLSFDRLDEALAFPVPTEARAAIRLGKDIEHLSQYILRVRNLKPDTYQLTIDDQKVATVTARDLQQGWNMGTMEGGPIAEQCRAILAEIARKDELVKTWREASRKQAAAPGAKVSQRLDELTARVEAADTAIRAAAQPVQRRCTLTMIP